MSHTWCRGAAHGSAEIAEMPSRKGAEAKKLPQKKSQVLVAIGLQDRFIDPEAFKLKVRRAKIRAAKTSFYKDHPAGHHHFDTINVCRGKLAIRSTPSHHDKKERWTQGQMEAAGNGAGKEDVEKDISCLADASTFELNE